MRLKSVAQSRAELSIVDRAANLEQEIRTSSGPAHLLRFVHSPIDKKVCGSFCNRSSYTQTGTVSLGVVDEPTTLASEITIDVKQCVPQPARRRASRVLAAFILVNMHDLADAVDAAPGILRLAVPNAPAQPFDLLDDHRLCLHPAGIVGRQPACCLRRVLDSHCDVKPIEEGWRRDTGIDKDRPKTGTAVGERGHFGVVGPANGAKGLWCKRGQPMAMLVS